MSKHPSLRINIPEPCKRAWNEMLPEDDGRFCLSCQKKVIDFSQMSDNEILQIISKAGAGSCGHFETSQIDRLIAPRPLPSRSFFPAALLVTLLGTTASVTGSGRPEIHTTTVATHPSAIDGPVCIDGRIIDAATGEGVRGVTIALKGSSLGTISDQMGYFRLTVSDACYSGMPVFSVSCIGYETITFTLDSSYTQPYTINMNKAVNNLQEVQVLSWSAAPGTHKTGAYTTVTVTTIDPGNWWQRLTRIFRKKGAVSPD